MRRIACIAISSLVVLLLAAAPSGAYVVLERTGLASSTGGIALGPDGNLWVSETGNNSVVRLRPNGDLIRRYAVGVAPGAMSVGAGGRVWVTMTGENSVGFFDATSPSPEFNSVQTGIACPSTDIADANGQLYMAIPSSSSATCDQVGSLPDDGGTAPMSNMTSATGAVRDITFRDGTVFASGSGGNTIDRFAPGLGDTNNPVDMPGPAGPIAFDGQDRLWTASPAGNALFRLSPAGAIDTVNVLGGQLTEPNDIVDGSDGQLYATGGTSQNVVRVDPNTSHTSFFPIGGGGRPDQIINGPDGGLYITDA